MPRTGPSFRLPADALGLGLRLPHYGYLFEHWPDIGYFEIISENFLGPSLPPRQKLARVRARYPVVLHGVGLNLLGQAPLNEAYLDQLCRLADEVDAPDHLCWTGAHGVTHHGLLPTPYVPELVEYAAERAARAASAGATVRAREPFELRGVREVDDDRVGLLRRGRARVGLSLHARRQQHLRLE